MSKQKILGKLAEKRKQIVDLLCSYIEKGIIPWKAEWDRFANIPINAISGVYYRGVNKLLLSFIAFHKGYNDPRWCTFKQSNSKEWKIKAGAKSARIEFFSFPKEEDLKKADAGEEVDPKKLHPMVRYYNVFNAEDIEGIPPLVTKKMEPIEQIHKAERVLKDLENLGVVINYRGNKAFYKSSTDEITIPPRELFFHTEGFYGTALHEGGHSTGHASRLNRASLLKYHESKEERAKEELIVEIASVFMCSEIGIRLSEEHYENHAAYIQNWLTALKNDPNELFRAANEASKISDYILEFERKREHENIVDIETDVLDQPASFLEDDEPDNEVFREAYKDTEQSDIEISM